MDAATLAALAGVLAAVVAAVVAIAALRRSRAGGEMDVLERQIPSALADLRVEMRAGLDGSVQTLNQRMSQFSGEIDRRLAELGGEVSRRLEASTGLIGQRLDSASRAVAEVHQRLGTVQGATERVLEVGKDIASLQQILKAPKLRGGLGELFLGELLAKILPAESFSLQYAFRGGQRVDAAVRLGERIVPIDAKFPLENFSRLVEAQDEASRTAARRAFVADVRKRIDEIADRYILPDENTYDFALMYVPAENVYYETIIRDEGTAGLYEYALERRVVPVSPNTLYSYLQVIVLGLKGLRIEERARDIMHALGGLGSEIDKFRSEFAVLGGHIENAGKKYGEADRRLQKLRDSVGRLETLGEGDVPGADRPSLPDAHEPKA